MSNPVTPPDGPRHHLGRDAGLDFYRIGAGVYRTDNHYWWPECAASQWRSCAVARRIALRQTEDEARRKRERALVREVAVDLAHGRRAR